jgi:hypothetical protein
VPEIIYSLCALTSLSCTYLLAKAYLRTPSSLLLWSSVCFLGLAFSNALLILDLIVFPQTDYGLLRTSITLFSYSVLLFGLVWNVD